MTLSQYFYRVVSNKILNFISVTWLLLLSTPSIGDSYEKLIFSIDLIRHGDRTPEIDIPNSPYDWQDNKGALTAEGFNQELELGKKLRKEYIEKYHLLPNQYKDGVLFVQATEVDRTIKSAQSVLNGLYPLSTRNVTNASPIQIKIVKKKDDHLLRANIIQTVLIQDVWMDKIEFMDSQLKHWSELTGLSLGKPENISQLVGLADHLLIRKIYKIPFPNGMDMKTVDEIIHLGEAVMLHSFRHHPMGRIFLETVINYFDQAIRKQTDLKYILFSAHDSSILSVMDALGVPLDHRPPYASRVNFSLFKRKKTYDIRVSYNWKKMHLPECIEMRCSIIQFKKAMKDSTQ